MTELVIVKLQLAGAIVPLTRRSAACTFKPATAKNTPANAKILFFIRQLTISKDKKWLITKNQKHFLKRTTTR
jgi:hypothetical protein